MSADLSQFYQVFFEETAEHLAGMEKLLLALDVSRPDMDNLNAIFRAAHSIKGGAGTFGFDDMTEVTHILETLLDRLRKQEMTLNAEMVNVFLEAKDVIAMQLGAHRGEGEVATDAVSNVCEKLQRLSSAPSTSAKGVGIPGGSLGNFGSGVDAGSDGDSASSDSPEDSDSGFFDDQPGAPAPEQAAPKGGSVPAAEATPKLQARVGAKIEIHGQGFGFFDDEPAAPPKQPSMFSSSPERRAVEITPRKENFRKDIPPGGGISKTESSSERVVSGGGTDSDFGFFDDQPGSPAPVENAPKKLTPAEAEAEAKAKRDFHGKGYGFF